jgi:hypothetical protein
VMLQPCLNCILWKLPFYVIALNVK